MTEPDLDEQAIEQYRHALTAEAALARGDLDEIEDHLRALATELRGSGLDAGAAVAEAARRLGDPPVIAREHARVRTTFGAKLPRWRAWGAAGLLLTFVVYWQLHSGFVGRGGVVTLALVLALGARWTWARAVMFGVLGMSALLMPLALAQSDAPLMPWLNWLAIAGAAGLIAPWRKAELSATGWALAVLPPAWAAAVAVAGFQITAPGGHVIALGSPIIAMWALVVTFAGSVLRARWAAAGAMVAAVMLAIAGAAILTLEPRFASPTLWRVHELLALAIAEVGLVAGAIMMWRSARSNLGTFRGLTA
jgi:hypothetical protein